MKREKGEDERENDEDERENDEDEKEKKEINLDLDLILRLQMSEE